VIRRLGADGRDLGTVEIPDLGAVYGTAFGPDGNLYVGDETRHVVVVADPVTGAVRRTIVRPDMCCPTGIAFAPFRFSARIRGKLVEAGKRPGRLGDPAALISVSPGSGSVLVQTTDFAARADVASVFPGNGTMTLCGGDVAAGDGRTRLLDGTSSAPGVLPGGFASSQIVVRGAADENGFFVPRSLSGSLHLVRSGAGYRADFRTSRRAP
jgi:hypothetical protein